MRAPRLSTFAATATIALLALSSSLNACIVIAQRPFPGPSTPPVVTAFDAVLNPSGDFIVVAGVGRVWRPHVAVVGPGFVPYLTGGRWVLTSAGWVFESRWSFGWAVFHYGHWVELSSVGWVWVPGDEWAPAWVEWKVGGGYVAWAPAPPPFWVVDWRPRWCFVEAHVLVTESWIERYVLPPAITHRASPMMTPIARRPGHPVAIGPPPAYVEQSAGVPVRIHEVTPPPPRSIGPAKLHEWSPPPRPVQPPPPGQPAPRVPHVVVPAPPPRAPALPPRKVSPTERLPPAVKPPPPAQPTPPPGHRERKDREPSANRAFAWRHSLA